jgi:hypothetical protein
MRKRGSFDGTMGGDNDLQNFIGKVFLKPDVAPFLTNRYPAVPLHCWRLA